MSTKTKPDRIDLERLARLENACGSQGWNIGDRQGPAAERFNRVREAIGANRLITVATIDEAEDALASVGLDLDEHSTPKQRAALVERREAEQAAQEQAQAEAEARAEAEAAAREATNAATEEQAARRAVLEQAEREAEVLEGAAARLAEEQKGIADALKSARDRLKAARRASA